MSQVGRLRENDIETLTGNSGGPVPPDGGGNINILGSAPIDVTGNPGTNTLTISDDGTIPTTFTEDSGTATPAANNLNIFGGTNITTSGAGSTVTINAHTGSQIVNITAVSSGPYVVGADDYYLSCDISGGAFDVELPNAPTTGRVIIVKDSTGNAATNNLTVTTVGGVVTIDGGTSFVMNTDYEAANFIFNGTSYEVF